MKKIWLAALILMSLLLTAVPLTAAAESDAGSAYSDVSGQWFTDAVTKYGYPEVFSDGSGAFRPGSDITRIEFARLLHRALGIQINYFAAPDVRDSFADMESTDTGAGELTDLVTAGIIEPGGSFTPDAPLIREEMIHWTMNALNYKTDGSYPMLMYMPAPFDDDSEISDAYKSEIYSSVVVGLVKGRGDNMLYPQDSATRAEAVTIVSRLMALLGSYLSDVDVTAAARLADDGVLTMSLTIRNNTAQEITLHHTSGQKFDFKLFDAEGNNLYTWSADKQFIALINETDIGPGEEIVFSDTLDSAAYEALDQAAKMTAYIVGTSEDFTIDADGYEAVIEMNSVGQSELS
jgi:hypothetical protein